MNRLIVTIVLLFCACSLVAQDQQGPSEQQVRSVIQQFEQGLRERKLPSIEPLVAENMVVFENGHRNDGWKYCRDNHLVPEMKEPAPPSRSEIVRITATPQMGWGYTRTDMTVARRTGEKVGAVLWSVYVLERRNGNGGSCCSTGACAYNNRARNKRVHTGPAG